MHGLHPRKDMKQRLIFTTLICCYLSLTAFSQQPTAVSYFEAGEAAYHKGNYEEALDLFGKCLALDAAYYEAYTARAGVKERLNDWKGAVIDYTIFLDFHPTDADALFSRALARYKAGQYEQSIEDLRRLLSVPSRETGSIFYRQSPYGGGTNQIITMQGKIRDYVLNYIGLAEMEMKHYDRAIHYFDSAIALNPRDADYYVHRGLTRERQGDLAAAEKNYTKALNINPDHAIALHNKGVLESRKGNASNAEEQLTASIERNPRLPYAYQERGYYRLNRGDLQGALADYNKAISIDKTDAENWLNRGIVREKLKDVDGAIDDYSAALELEPEYEKAWLSRGNALSKQGKYEEAIEDYTVAIFYHPEYGQAYYNRAIVYQRMGNMSQACADLKMAMQHGMEVQEKMRRVMCDGE